MKGPFASLLSELIDNTGYNVDQIAKMAGVHRNTLRNWVNDEVTKPRNLDQLFSVAEQLSISTSVFEDLLDTCGYPGLVEIERNPKYRIDRKLLLPWFEKIEETPFQAPARPVDFIGREDLLLDFKTILSQNEHERIIVLHGMAGVGKTTLATKLAYELRDSFSDGVLWVELTNADVMSSLAMLARVLKEDVSTLNDIQSRSAVVRSILKAKRLLLVFDDVQNDVQLKALLPPTGKCAVIVTTRHEEIWEARSGGPFRIPAFDASKDESLLYFSRILGNAFVLKSEETFRQMAILLGHLPLALDIVAHRLKRDPELTPADFVSLLREAKNRLDELNYGNTNVRAAFEVSFARFRNQEIGTFYAALSVFAGNSFDRPAILQIIERREEYARRYLRELRECSLIQFLPDKKRYQLHTLLTEFARENLAEAMHFERLLARYYLRYLQNHADDFDLLDNEYHNIRLALNYIQTLPLSDLMVDSAILAFPYLDARGLLTDAMATLEGAEVIAVEIGEPTAVAKISLYRAYISRKKGQLSEAESLLMRGLELLDAKTHPAEMCPILRELGAILTRLGQYERGENFLKQGMAIAKDTGNDQMLCEMHHNMGLVNYHLGNYDDAETYYQLALANAEQRSDEHQIMMTRVNLASVLGQRGKLEEMKQSLLQGLEIARKKRNLEERLVILQNLSVIATYQGDLPSGSTYIDESLKLTYRYGYTYRLPDLLTVAGGIAERRGLFADAKRYYSDGLELAIANDNVKAILGLRENLGSLLIVEGDFEAATLQLQPGMILARELQNIERTVALKAVYGALQTKQGNLEEAEQLLTESLVLADEQHIQLQECRLHYHFGELYRAKAEADRAYESYFKAKEIAEEPSMSAQVELGEAMFGLAKIEHLRGNIEAALSWARQSHAIFAKMGHYKASELSSWILKLKPRSLN